MQSVWRKEYTLDSAEMSVTPRQPTKVNVCTLDREDTFVTAGLLLKHNVLANDLPEADRQITVDL